MTDQLDAINAAYYESEDKEAAIEALQALHVPLLRKPDELRPFVHQAARVAGGTYLPYLFWIELVKFMDGKGDSELLYDLVLAFTESDFDEEDLHKIKPLLVVYFAKERVFQIDRIKAQIVEKSHPSVRDFFYDLYKFVETNHVSTQTYHTKLVMLKKYFPDFERFELPIPQLEEELGE